MAQDVKLEMARRLDAFVDAAFAFAITLLIAGGGTPPAGMAELADALLRAPAYAACFALIVMFWLGYRDVGRLWPSRDGVSTTLSLAIVFLVLLYVFPLRLMIESAFHALSGGLLPGGELAGTVTELRFLYVSYGSGCLILSLLFAMLYGHHLRQGTATPLQAWNGRVWVVNWSILMWVSFMSLLIAVLAPAGIAVWAAGMIYMLIPVAIGLTSAFRRKPVATAPLPAT